MGPRQLLDFGDTELLVRLIVKFLWLQCAQRSALGLGQKVDARHNQVEMFGVGEIGNKGQNQPQRHPPTDMLAGY